jgi:hypothetical protein
MEKPQPQLQGTSRLIFKHGLCKKPRHANGGVFFYAAAALPVAQNENCKQMSDKQGA